MPTVEDSWEGRLASAGTSSLSVGLNHTRGVHSKQFTDLHSPLLIIQGTLEDKKVKNVQPFEDLQD